MTLIPSGLQFKVGELLTGLSDGPIRVLNRAGNARYYFPNVAYSIKRRMWS